MKIIYPFYALDCKKKLIFYHISPYAVISQKQMQENQHFLYEILRFQAHINIVGIAE